MRECGTPNVPSFSALRAKQAALLKEVDIETGKHISTLGNYFYMNKPSKLLALDWANPLVREHINLYPEVATPSLSESWQAQKCAVEANDDRIAPMWADWQHAPHRHFFVKELAQLKDGQYVIPLQWVLVRGVESAQVKIVQHCEGSGKFTVDTSEPVIIPASHFNTNFLDIQEMHGSLHFHDDSTEWSILMPHPFPERAQGHAVFTIFLMSWNDDVSGNVTKQFNAHLNTYLVNGNLPHRLLSQEFHVRFSATSPHAGALEQMDALCDDVGLDKLHDAYDSQLEQDILFNIVPHLVTADNPQHSEHCSHIGMHGNKFCRRCDIGGNAEEKESDAGYLSLFKPGSSRTVPGTLSAVLQQIEVAALGIQERVDSLQTASGIKDKLAQVWISQLIPMARALQTSRLTNSDTKDARLHDRNLKALRAQLRPGDHYNPLLAMQGLDVHADTSVEILHTYLLGQDKYTWYASHKLWDEKTEKMFATRLQSSSLDGLSIPPLRASYMMQYKNALIGKHFKSLQQLAIFHMHDVVPKLIFDLWKATGELGAMLWYHTIDNLESYLEDLQVLIDNVLDIWALIDPARIIDKPKLHKLSHLVPDIKRFGPAILYSTEIFECFNGVFRMCSMLSNHAAPSRDIALTLADIERMKHMASGGWWKDGDGSLVRAGPQVRSVLQRDPKIQRRLGWVNTKPHPAAKSFLAPWSEHIALLHHPHPLLHPSTQPSTVWNQCRHVISQSQDICRVDSWIFFTAAEAEALTAIHNVRFTCDSCAVVIIEVYSILLDRHAHLNMPVMKCSQTPDSMKMSALFVFNAQHDCSSSKCQIAEGTRFARQERKVTNIPKQAVQHADDDNFVINMHAIHNAALLRATLPRILTRPIPYHQDREAMRKQVAAGLRILGPAKRAATKAKGAETRARKQKDAAGVAGTVSNTSTHAAESTSLVSSSG
ncbi:hypothetical protein OF83DRAFT_1166297 [Amylostereum chailletii]|nr:hypothetical protein OF83DRAFT_1166297 [Amylostereum chailletii]